MSDNPKISILLPCLNEEEAIKPCLDSLSAIVGKEKLDTEVIVIDNGSEDNSQKVVKSFSEKIPYLRIVSEKERGYGNAYQKGIDFAKGEIIVMADIDRTYNFKDITKLITEIDNGADFVIGNRFTGGMKRDAMVWHHKFIGNPGLSYLVRLFFGTGVRDVHCGLRAITRESLDKLNLQTAGMEFASEMVIKAVRDKLKISEVDISYHPRTGDSKLKSFSDGWRHLRFMLLYSPYFSYF